MGLASTSMEDTDGISPYPNEGTHAQLVCSGLAHVCGHSIESLVEILFSVVLNILSYITFPQIKENIIQTKYTFEPQHVRRQLGSVSNERNLRVYPSPSMLAGYVLVSSWVRRQEG